MGQREYLLPATCYSADFLLYVIFIHDHSCTRVQVQVLLGYMSQGTSSTSTVLHGCVGLFERQLSSKECLSMYNCHVSVTIPRLVQGMSYLIIASETLLAAHANWKPGV